MKKIGVVSEVNYRGPGTTGVSNFTNEDPFIYISEFKITVYNENTKSLKKLEIMCEEEEYNSLNDNILYLGDIVEYDTETMVAKKIECLTKEKLRIIDIMQKELLEIIEILKEPNFKDALAKCKNIEQVKQIAKILKHKNKHEQQLLIMNINLIFTTMSQNLESIGEIEEDNTSETLTDENLIIVMKNLENQTKIHYEKVINSEIFIVNDLDKLLSLYMMCDFYETIACKRNIHNVYQFANLEEIKSFLDEQGMLSIEAEKQIVKKI